MSLEPAHSVVAKLGGDTVVAAALGIHRTRVAAWKRDKRRGGTGGRIPAWHIPFLLKLARKCSVPLTGDECLGVVVASKRRRA